MHAGSRGGAETGRGLSVQDRRRNTAFSSGPSDTTDYRQLRMGPRHPHPFPATRGEKRLRGSNRVGGIQRALIARPPCERRGRGHRRVAVEGHRQGASCLTQSPYTNCTGLQTTRRIGNSDCWTLQLVTLQSEWLGQCVWCLPLATSSGPLPMARRRYTRNN